ncbi:MAG: glycine cleavage system protein GcvH [Rickettsiales bacterium]|nr:glycine cleavage system protein GcvH [Rickettsiales bacterium]
MSIKYTKEHETIRVEGDIITIGITDYAKDALGDLVFIQLPEKGLNVKKGQDFAVVESVKIASEIYTPVSGEIVEVNSTLADNVDDLKLNLEKGWIAKIKMSNPTELSDLMDENSYKEYLKSL